MDKEMKIVDLILERHAFLSDKKQDLNWCLMGLKDTKSSEYKELELQKSVTQGQIAILDDLYWHLDNGKGWTWKPECILKDRQ